MIIPPSLLKRVCESLGLKKFHANALDGSIIVEAWNSMNPDVAARLVAGISQAFPTTPVRLMFETLGGIRGFIDSDAPKVMHPPMLGPFEKLPPKIERGVHARYEKQRRDFEARAAARRRQEIERAAAEFSAAVDGVLEEER